jgi:hypothetical protein
MCMVLENHNIRKPTLRFLARGVRYVFSLLNAPQVPFHLGGWGMHVSYVWRGGYIRINGGLRVLELAADIREAALGRAIRRPACGRRPCPKGGTTRARHDQDTSN